MDTLTSCRALLSGATLIAATAMAAPNHAPATVSPCLEQTHSGQAPTAQQRDSWRKQCRLSDAEKADDEYKNEGASPKDQRELVDEAMALSRLAAPADDTNALNLMAPQGYGSGDDWQPQASGGPGSTAFNDNPMYQSQLRHVPLRQGGAGVQGEIPAVPEPANVAMLLAGLALLAGVAARKRRAS
jgi:hypothetical protein